MQTVPSLLGIAHPTGYPLYVLIGHLFSYIPVGSPAYRANLLSAVCASAALGILVLTLGRLKIRPAVAVAMTLCFAASPSLWSNATRAEVHTLHLLFLSAILHRLVVWSQDQRPRDLVIGATWLGLSFGNHMLTSTVAPFVAGYALWTGRKTLARDLRPLLVATLGFILALGVYAYLPIRASQNPVLAYNHPTTWEGLRYLVTGEQFRSDMTFLSLEGVGRFLSKWPTWRATVVADASPVFALLAVIGMWACFQAGTGFAIFSLGLLLTNVYVYASYQNADLNRYLFASWLTLVVWAATGLQWILDRIHIDRWGWARHAVWVTPLLPAWLMVTHFSMMDQSGNHQGERFVKEIFDHLEPGATILTYWDASTPLWYAHHIENRRPDITILDDTNMAYDGWGGLEGAAVTLSRSRPVYVYRMFDQEVDRLRRAFSLHPVATIRGAYGRTSADYDRPLYRLVPLAP